MASSMRGYLLFMYCLTSMWQTRERGMLGIGLNR